MLSMIPHTIPSILLNNGFRIPVLGIGTWQSRSCEVITAIETAIDLGYRHIDCAHFYKNEFEIGTALYDKMRQGAVNRKDLFITGKLWNTFHRPDLVEIAIKKSLYDLKVDHLDLYLIHWPMAYKECKNILVPMKDRKVLYSEVHYIDTWQAMERLVRKGYTKSIGVSNFNKRQLQHILCCSCIKPVINQIECHPYLNQKSLMEFCKSNNIAVTCYSPLGAPGRARANQHEITILENSNILTIAERLCKTPAQIVLRYQIQRGNIVIPKSVTPARIRENMEIFDFELSCEDMEELDCLNKGKRYITSERDLYHPLYPFKEKA